MGVERKETKVDLGHKIRTGKESREEAYTAGAGEGARFIGVLKHQELM